MSPTDERPATVTRERAAQLLRCSVRTVDRHIPPGTPGRTDYREHPGPVQIDLSLVQALMPLPGGDDVDRDD